MSAAINASILPVVERTARIVEEALHEAGLDVPLLVLRGDGGAMSVEAFRRAAVAHDRLRAGGGRRGRAAPARGCRDAIVVECGGTSSNVSVVKRGRPVLRSLRVMGRPTCDPRDRQLGGRRRRRQHGAAGPPPVAEVGPRSAHVAGLPYACFAEPDELRGRRARARRAARRATPRQYAVRRAPGGRSTR